MARDSLMTCISLFKPESRSRWPSVAAASCETRPSNSALEPSTCAAMEALRSRKIESIFSS